jgi:hypothetical protein
MKEHIKELCNSKKIKPVYTENKLTILSNGSQYGFPILRIHKIFKNCSKKTAQAIVNYYFDTENKEKYIMQIKMHAQKYLGAVGYRIAPMSDKFIDALILNYDPGKENTDLQTILTEHTIFSMIQKDFGTNHSAITDGIIKVQDNDMIELDIVVDG